MNRTRAVAALAAAGVLALAPSLSAQFPNLKLTELSPAASVTQTVGFTEMEVTYHRPAVKGREIWGKLVPYGEPWRAGANENTTVRFSTPVTVEGKPLAAGTYGLHMIPSADRWTVAFGRESQAWGSFSYDPKEDALRVEVKPVAAPFQERLGYTFDEPTDDATTLTLRWETLAVPIAIHTDLGATGLADVREQLRGLPRFGWQGWNTAARFSLDHHGDPAEAMAWVDQSIKVQRNFTNLTTKADLLAAAGDAAGSAKLRDEADSIATEAERNAFGYALLGAGKVNEAVTVFEKNAAAHPDSWNVHDSLAEAYAAAGQKAKAIASYERAAKLVKDDAQKKRIGLAIAALR